MKPSVIGVIPARYGSQRLSAKPLIDLLGKTMVERVYAQAKKAKLLDRVLVATDDRRIEEAVIKFGGEAVMTSPKIKSGSDRIAAVAEKTDGDIFVNIQGDEPLMAPQMIDEAIRVVLDDDNAHVGTLAKEIQTVEELLNPAVVKVVLRSDRYALYFSRSPIPYVRDAAEFRQWLKHQTFYKHIGLYVFRKSFLKRYAKMSESSLEKSERLEQLRILENGYTIKVALTALDSFPIDTLEDVERVLAVLKSSNTHS